MDSRHIVKVFDADPFHAHPLLLSEIEFDTEAQARKFVRRVPMTEGLEIKLEGYSPLAHRWWYEPVLAFLTKLDTGLWCVGCYQVAVWLSGS